MKRRALARSDGLSGARADQDFLLAQNYLVEGIVKFECCFEAADVAHAVVLNCAGDVGEFLIQEIGGAGHLDVREVDALGVSVLRLAEREFFFGRVTGRARRARK